MWWTIQSEPLQKLTFYVHYDLNKDFVDKQNEIIKNITKEEINGLAKDKLPVDKMNILVVGDKASVKPGLAQMGYEIVELDTKGNVVKDDTKIESGKK